MRQIVKSSLGKAKYILFCGVMTTFWRRDGTIINFFSNYYVFYNNDMPPKRHVFTKLIYLT